VSTGARSTRTPWGGVELLERAVGYTRGSLVLVTPRLMSAPTPCAGWDLEALLAHMHDSIESLHEAGSVRRVSVGVTGTPPADLVGALRAGACRLLAEWSLEAEPASDVAAPSAEPPGHVLVDGRPLTPRVLTSAGALEVAVHGWDVAAACGAPRPIPEDLASDLLRVAHAVVSESDRPSLFAPPLPPEPGAAAGEELLAFLGREP
jgi:uncharacterized protein (TIGR03086 family)